MAYASVEQLRAYLEQTDEGDESLLTDILERAEALVDEELGFSFIDWDVDAEPSERDVKCGAGGEYLYLPAHDEGSVASVEAVYARGAETETTEAITDYTVEPRWRLYRRAGWVRGQWYRVAAIWGYGPPPTAITEVTLEVAANLWRGRHAVGWTSAVGAEGGGSVQVQRALTWAQRHTIERVRARYPQESSA